MPTAGVSRATNNTMTPTLARIHKQCRWTQRRQWFSLVKWRTSVRMHGTGSAGKPLCETTHTHTPMHRWQYPSAQARLDLDRHLRPRQRPNTPVVRSGILCKVPLEQRGQPEVGVLSAESLAEQGFPMWPLKCTKSCAQRKHALDGTQGSCQSWCDRKHGARTTIES
jgi:hypothetical protein